MAVTPKKDWVEVPYWATLPVHGWVETSEPFTYNNILALVSVLAPKFLSVTVTVVLAPAQITPDGAVNAVTPASLLVSVNSSAPIQGVVTLRVWPSISVVIPVTGVPVWNSAVALECKSVFELNDGFELIECASSGLYVAWKPDAKVELV